MKGSDKIFSRTKNPKGFHRVIQYGSKGNEMIVFYIRLADGRDYPAVQIRTKTRNELAKILLNFRRARREILNSSKNLFGGNFPVGSLRWLACYSGFVRDFSGKKIRKVNFKSSYLQSILNGVA